MSSPFEGFKLGEIRVIKNDWLPAGTMIVSSDVYGLLTETPEQQAERQSLFAAQVASLDELIKRQRLSPTGRRPSEPEFQPLPKDPTEQR